MASTARVFSTAEIANRWYRWAAGGKLALCNAQAWRKRFESSGYGGVRARRFRQSFKPSCFDCPAFTASSWAIEVAGSKSGSESELYEDLVIVRSDRIVLTFIFEQFVYRFFDAEGTVEQVLERIP